MRKTLWLLWVAAQHSACWMQVHSPMQDGTGWCCSSTSPAQVNMWIRCDWVAGSGFGMPSNELARGHWAAAKEQAHPHAAPHPHRMQVLSPCEDGSDVTLGLHAPQNGDRHHCPDAKVTSKTTSTACVGLHHGAHGAVYGVTDPHVFGKTRRGLGCTYWGAMPGADWLCRLQICPPADCVCKASVYTPSPSPMTTTMTDLDSGAYMHHLGPGDLRSPGLFCLSTIQQAVAGHSTNPLPARVGNAIISPEVEVQGLSR
ncbi:hypothetical protein B0H10DRAFT_1948528 [Mycena sp. CBHHK59/15]|nr:hypothetical protein B0H10DRAFT_1948528 [Mycena sp. CBHHK59/15]